MDRKKSWLIPVLLAAGAAAALAYYWLSIPDPAPETVAEQTEQQEEAGASGPQFPMQPLESVRDENRELVPLPPLSDSDAYFRLEILGLFGKQLDEILANEALIERFVATIDNLPRAHVAERLRPVGQVSGTFTVEESDDDIVLSPANFERYRYLIDMFVNADVDALVEAYRRYYPLFQEAYVSLGYPNGYFNDRLVEVIDHLLQTPEVSEPVELARPHVLYEYADPELESMSSGQKMMLRMGRANAERLKQALTQLRSRIASAD